MSYAIIRGKNGRRHEVDFEDTPVRIEFGSSEHVVEIRVEADWETRPDGKRRFVHLNIPRDQFIAAMSASARGKAKLSPV